MLTLMAMLGIIMTGFAVDWAIDAFDDNEDDTENPDPDTPIDPTTHAAIEGVQDTNDLLTGSADSDTIIGNETDADTLIGGAGDDVLTLHHGNLGTGGEGSDTFVMDEDDRTRTFIQIDDFEPGVDTLEILHEVGPGDTTQPHITIIEGESTILQIRDASDPDSDTYSRIGLTGTTGFSVDDLVITFVDAGGIPVSTAAPNLAFDTREGTTGDDAISFSNPNTIYQVSSGEGDDTVVSHSAIVTVDLGGGDDDYYGNPTLPDGYVHDTTTNGVHSEEYFAAEIVDGGAGNDTIVSGNSNCIIDGGDGDDMIDILAHNYDVDGGAGNDRISIGSDSHGSARGGAGDDHIHGGSGDDRMSGDAGDDSLFGLDGNDVLYGGTGSDYLDGGAGEDRLTFGAGDIAAGGADADYFYAWTGNETGTAPRVTDFEADIDLMELELAPSVQSITDIDVTYDASTDMTNIYADGVLSLVMDGDQSGLTIAFSNTPSSDHNVPTGGYFDDDGTAVDAADVDVKIYLWQQVYG